MKTALIHFLMLALSFSLVACTDEEKGAAPDVPISFSPAINASTRATQSVYPSDTPFTVWAYTLPEGKAWSSFSAEALQYACASRVEFNGENWLPAPSMEWPGRENVTFFAFSPDGMNAGFTKEYGVTVNGFDATSGLLPMFTEPVADCTAYNTQGCIAMTFVHALSKVEFEVRSVADSTIVLKSLSMDDIKYIGDFSSLPSPQWKTDNRTMSVEFCKDNYVVGRVAKPVGNLMLMGQKINSKAILVVDILDKEGNVVVKDRRIESPVFVDKWIPGKYYRYTLNLTTSSVYSDSEVLRRFDF